MLASIRLAVARSTRSDRSCLSCGSNDRENDLPAHVSMFYLLQGKSGLLERIDVVDDRLTAIRSRRAGISATRADLVAG
jgi:hypothetical protein